MSSILKTSSCSPSLVLHNLQARPSLHLCRADPIELSLAPPFGALVAAAGITGEDEESAIADPPDPSAFLPVLICANIPLSDDDDVGSPAISARFAATSSGSHRSSCFDISGAMGQSEAVY